MQVHQVKDFIKSIGHLQIIDVRSPAEFEKGHIPGAINIPLFTNEERAVVGTSYKQLGKNTAVKQGLEIVGPKMVWMLEELEKVNTDKEIGLYCWRGGMRSSSVAWLFETSGYECNVLEGGYKNYRALMNTLFDEHDIILIGGETGSGKTEVLTKLESLGEQTIDLEALANHKGSAFGSIGMSSQPTNEHFQNLVIDSFLNLDPNCRVFLEDESSHIGRVNIPEKLWQKMQRSPLLSLSIPLESRVTRLVKDYGIDNKTELEKCIRKIERKLGGQNMKAALESLDQGDLKSVARLMLNYYDKSYRFLLERKKENIIAKIQLEDANTTRIAEEIIKKFEEVDV